MLHADAQYADVLERVIYNGVLSGIGLDGEHFFYVNPLAADGTHHRQPFYPCACCPTNVVRFLPSLPGYLYATGQDGIVVNLYAAGEATVITTILRSRCGRRRNTPGRAACVLTVSPPAEKKFALRLRIPQWCSGSHLESQWQADAKPRVSSPVMRCSRGPGSRGMSSNWSLPMEVQRIEAHPQVTADAGRVALQRGPLVYCFEAVDNANRVANIVLDRDPQFRVERQDNLLGGIRAIHARARGGREVMAVPYYAWDHREPGPMQVWVRQDGKPREPTAEDPGWSGRLYRPLDPATLGPSEPPQLSDLLSPSASHCWQRDSVGALLDGREPKNSHDESLPRFTWWDRQGTSEWVQYDAEQPMTCQRRQCLLV